jgi:hypothetical protein
MSEIWVRKDRKVKMIVKGLGELFIPDIGGTSILFFTKNNYCIPKKQYVRL